MGNAGFLSFFVVLAEISSDVKEFFRNDGGHDGHGVPAKEDGFARGAGSCRPFLQGIFERDRRLPPSLRTSPPRDFESSGLVEAERHVTAGGVDEPAAPRGGRSHPHPGSCLPRTKPPVDHLEACQRAAGHRAVSHRRTRWASRSVHPLGLGPPSPTTAAGTASARSVRPLPVKGGSQHVKENFSRRASSMRSSHYPTGSRPGWFSIHNNRPQPPPFRFELETRGHWCIIFRKANSSRKFSDEMYSVGPRASGRLGPGPTKSSAVGSYFKAGIPVLSFTLSSRGVWVSLFRRGYRPVSGLANSVSGLTSGETFVAGD